MKTRITALGFVLLFITTISCTHLEDQSYHNIIADQFEATDDDIAALLASAYIPWRQTMLLWNGVVRAQMLSSDHDVIPSRPNGWVDGGVYKRIHQHKWTAEEEIVVNSWSRTYTGVNACNRVIYQIENEINIEDEEEKESYIAELKVLRASYYYILVDLFGNVPLVTRFDVEEGYLPEQNTRKEVYEFIISEITGNINKLSETVGGTHYGRFNKWAAYSLLAKMYLNAEIFSDGSHIEWQKCITACNEVINSTRYELESKQSNVFITNNENSHEIIMALAFDEVYVNDWNAFDFHMYTLQPVNQATYNFTASPWGGVCSIPQFIDTFDPDDARLQGFIHGQQYAYNGDMLYSEMGESMGQPLNYINEVPSIDNSHENHGYRWGKFEYAIGITNRLSNDWPLFRYADILLMKAEALLRNGQADEAAILVTEIRMRNFSENPIKATVTGDDLTEGSSYDYGRRDNLVPHTHEGGSDIQYGRLLDELGWEFHQEGRRRQDMIRFDVFTTKSWFSHDASGEHLKLFPIPQAQLLANGKLKQNTGY